MGARGRTIAGGGFTTAVNYFVVAIPATAFSVLEVELNADPTKLGSIVTVQASLAAASMLVWGWLCDVYPRPIVWTASIVIWGFFSVLLAFSDAFLTFLIFRGLSGLGLKAGDITTASLIADVYSTKERGKGFGVFGLFMLLGLIVGTLLSSNLSGVKVHDVSGWRILLLVGGLLAIPCMTATLFLVPEPARGQADDTPKKNGTPPSVVSQHVTTIPDLNLSDSGDEEHRTALRPETLKEVASAYWESVRHIVRNKAVLVQSIERVFAAFPIVSLAFMPLWLEYAGLSRSQTGVAYAATILGAMLGTMCGGLSGDFAAKHSPDRGRLMLAQLSTSTAMVLLVVLIVVVPRGPDSMPSFSVLLFVLGILTPFSGFGCDYVMTTELVPMELRAHAFSCVSFVVSLVGAFSPLLTGVIADYWFGYKQRSQDINDLTPQARENNLAALSNSVLVIFLGSWMMQVLVYIPMYKLYPTYRDSSREDVVVEGELWAVSSEAFAGEQQEAAPTEQRGK